MVSSIFILSGNITMATALSYEHYTDICIDCPLMLNFSIRTVKADFAWSLILAYERRMYGKHLWQTDEKELAHVLIRCYFVNVAVTGDCHCEFVFFLDDIGT